MCINTKRFPVNLSCYEPIQDEKGCMDLGFSCSPQTRHDELHKKTELEMLYQSLTKLRVIQGRFSSTRTLSPTANGEYKTPK